MVACLILAATAGGAAPDSALPPAPAALEVSGGEESWHPTRDFRLRAPQPAGEPVTAIDSVHYRILDPLGATVGAEGWRPWPGGDIGPLRVAALPGVYTAEVWFEDTRGRPGPAKAVKLRFDDTRPGEASPIDEKAWIGRSALPLTVRLTHPSAAAPPSGIRGYAVSVDASAGGRPCATPDRCSEAETDLGGGPAHDAFSIGELPEGTSYVHAVAVSGSGVSSASVGSVALRVDKTAPAVELSGVLPGWATDPVTLTATAFDDGSGMLPGQGGAAPFSAIRVDAAAPVIAAGDTVSAQVIAEGTHRVAYYARDLAGNVDDGQSSNGVPNPAPETALLRIDRTPPSIAFHNAQDPREPESIRAAVSDTTSGVDRASGWIAMRRAGSGDPFQPLPAEIGEPGDLRAHWDSDAYPPGDYEFAAGLRDVAGNRAATAHRANGSTMVLSNPLKTPTAATAAFRGGKLARRAPYGRSVLLGGRLVGGNGQPLGREPVRIVERFEGGTPASRESTVWTDPDGRFAARLAAGPNREALAVFEGSPTLTRAASRPLRLAVRSSVRLHASAARARVGGPPLVFSGRVAATAGTMPRAGKSVELQFRLPGGPWTEFRTIETDRRGRFRYAYRFSDDDSRGVAFQFRAYAPAQDGWPYEPAGSLPVVVRGR